MRLPFNLPSLGIFLCLVTGLASCGDLEQNLRINKDGSGTLETSMDIGELLGMAKGFEDMGSFQDSITDDSILFNPEPVTEPAKDAMTLLIEKITDPNHDKDFDTIMSILTIMPDSVREKETRPDLAEKMFLRLKSPANSADLNFGFLMHFNNTDHLQEMINYMETINQNSGNMTAGSPVGMDSKSFLTFNADMKAGIIQVDTVYYTGFVEEFGLGQDSLMMNTEDMGMMEMMFGNSKIKSIIHVPGEVISCTNPDAILTKDNKVIVEYPFMDAIRKGKIDGFTVRFKP